MKLFLFFLFFASVAMADVDTFLHEDEMTNEQRFVISFSGEEVEIDQFTKYTPWLVFAFDNPKINEDGNLFHKGSDISFRIQSDGFKRYADVMSYKLGTNDLVKVVMKTSDDRRSAFVPRKSEFLKLLKTSDKVLFRFTTTLGAVRTLKFTGFNPTSLRDAAKKWIRENPGKLKKYKK